MKPSSFRSLASTAVSATTSSGEHQANTLSACAAAECARPGSQVMKIPASSLDVTEPMKKSQHNRLNVVNTTWLAVDFSGVVSNISSTQSTRLTGLHMQSRCCTQMERVHRCSDYKA